MRSITFAGLLLAVATALPAQVRVRGDTSRVDTAKKVLAPPASQQGNLAPSTTTSERRIPTGARSCANPIGKDGCAVVRHDTVTRIVQTPGPIQYVPVAAPAPQALNPCGGFGGFLSCNWKPILGTAVAAVAVVGATELIIACTKGKGMCGGNDVNQSVTQSQTVNASRAVPLIRIPIGF